MDFFYHLLQKEHQEKNWIGDLPEMKHLIVFSG